MNNGWYIKVIFDQGIWQLVEEKGGTSAAEGEDLIKIILINPPRTCPKVPNPLDGLEWFEMLTGSSLLSQIPTSHDQGPGQ